MKQKKAGKGKTRRVWGIHCDPCEKVPFQKGNKYMAVFRTRADAREDLHNWLHHGGNVRVVRVEVREI